MKRLRKAFLKVIPLCLLIAFFVPINGLAANYPIVSFYEDEDYKNLIYSTTAEVGETVVIRMQWIAAFNNEGYDLVIYDSEGNAVSTASNTFSYHDLISHISLNWNTAGRKSGVYRAVVTKKFYSLYRWNEAPTQSTLEITLVDKPEANTEIEPTNSTKVSTGSTTKAKARKKASNLNKTTVKAVDIRKASSLGATTVTLGPKVKKISPNAFKNTKIKKIVIKTKKLKAKTVKNSLKGSKVKTIKVSIGKKATNKKYVKIYKKIFTKKIAGKKVSVKL